MFYSKKRNFKIDFRKKFFNFDEKNLVHIFLCIFWHQTAHYLRATPKSIRANIHTQTHSNSTHTYTQREKHTHKHTHTHTHTHTHSH